MIDAWILNFIRENPVTIGILLWLLQTLARELPWAKNDKVFQIFTGLFDVYKNRSKK